MAGYPATGTFSYNGFTFAGARNIGVQTENVYDEAGRAVVCVRYTLTVSAIITAESISTDATLESMRILLSKPGRQLVFINEGFGTNLIVNNINGGGIRDVEWGPKPQVLQWNSVGNNQAVHVVWSVTTCIPECTDARYSGIRALNYEVTYAVDEQGDTQRTIAGYLEIAQTWNGVSRVPPDDADAYREQIAPAAPDGFQRHQSWRLSKDKSRLDFTIVDREIASNNPYPEDVTAIAGRHSVDWQMGPRTGMMFVQSIDVEATGKRGIEGTKLWQIFWTIVEQRRQTAIQAGNDPFLTRLHVSEDLFGRAAGFSAGYWFPSTVADFVKDSGLWQPLGTDWNTWRVSLAGHTFNQRGHAGLLNSPANDAIVDLCGTAQSVLNESGASQPTTPSPGVKSPFKNDPPPQDKSYLYFESGVSVSQRNKAVQQTKLQTPPTDSGAEGSYPAGSVPDIVQVRGAPSYLYALKGQATRAGYEIARPAITSIGGQAVKAFGDGMFESILVGNFFGVPVYAARWLLYYAVQSPAGNLTSPDNPQQAVMGGQAQQPV